MGRISTSGECTATATTVAVLVPSIRTSVHIPETSLRPEDGQESLIALQSRRGDDWS
jgi:hypothetical protein